ncbi:MAG TPA: cupin domain-containing protein [Actinomycetota bacterium]|nr:cupin domain-containing protein [Actinomycetota bacterium]
MTDGTRDGTRMSLPPTTSGYALGPDDGEALWFNGGLGLLKATADQTDGRFAAFELRLPKGFASPIHLHEAEDEFFLVLSGEVRVQHGDEVAEGVAGSLAYSPRGVSHGFHVDSEEARLLLLFGPAGVENFFREVATPARSFGPPPPDEPVPDRDTLVQIMSRHAQTVVAPPLPPKD